MKIKIKGKHFYKPLRWQSIVHNHPARFKVLICGTKAGKTTFAINEAVEEAVFNAPSFVRWVAPVYDQAEIGWRRLWSDPPEYPSGYIPRQLVQRKHEAEMWVELLGIGGGLSRIEFKSADKPEHLRGEDVNLIIVDEADECKERAWWILESNITKTKGRAIIITTPSHRGRTWVYELAQQGTKYPNTYDVKTWFFPTFVNPKIDREELERKEKNIPRDEWKREYLAEFLLSDEGSVFKYDDIKNCIKGELEEYRSSKIYVMGVDVGKDVDATVISVLDMNGHLCYFKRIPPNTMDYPMIIEEIKRISMEYGNAYTLIDSTGVGNPVYEDLLNMGVPIEKFDISSNKIKSQLINRLRIAIEKGEVTFPPIDDLVNELESFTYIKKTGGIRYTAPPRLHDDCVISLALAVWAEENCGDPTAIICG